MAKTIAERANALPLLSHIVKLLWVVDNPCGSKTTLDTFEVITGSFTEVWCDFKSVGAPATGWVTTIHPELQLAPQAVEPGEPNGHTATLTARSSATPRA